MTSEELNIKVAELKGWTIKNEDPLEDGTRWVLYDPFGKGIAHGRDKRPKDLSSYAGVFYDSYLPAFTSDLNAAFSLLEGQNFVVFTCDMGYSCKIYTAPEHGEEELAEGFADTVPVAICRAFVKLKGVEV